MDDAASTPARRKSKGLLTRAHRAVVRVLWERDERALGPWARRGLVLLRLLYLTGGSFFRERLQSRAGALAFSTLLALVPTAALVFATAKAVGAYDALVRDTIRPYLAEIFAAPDGQELNEGLVTLRDTTDHLLRMVGETDVSSLGIAGLVMVLLAIARVLMGAEEAFDAMWGFPSHRSFLAGVPRIVLVGLTTGPILMVATTLTAAGQQHELMEHVRAWIPLPNLVDGLAFFVPPLLVIVGLLPAYLLLPSARVQFRSALLGAVVGGLCWYVLQVYHVRFQVGVARYNALYSGFGAFPIFLLWLHFSWVFVLLGAQAAAAHQNAPTLRQLARGRLKDHNERQAVALRAMVEIGQRQEGRHLRALAVDLGVGVEALRECLDALVDHRLLGKEGALFDPCYRSVTDPATVRVTSVLDALERTTESAELAAVWVEDDEGVQAVLEGLQSAADASDHNRTLAELHAKAREQKRDELQIPERVQ